MWFWVILMINILKDMIFRRVISFFCSFFPIQTLREKSSSVTLASLTAYHLNTSFNYNQIQHHFSFSSLRNVKQSLRLHNKFIVWCTDLMLSNQTAEDFTLSRNMIFWPLSELIFSDHCYTAADLLYRLLRNCLNFAFSDCSQHI